VTNRTPEGDQFGYVGEILDPNWTPDTAAAPRIEAPICGTMLPMPAPGIYFGMAEETYFAIGACSTSELKRLRVSSMEAWAYSRRNSDYEDKASPFLDHGKAVHCLVLEGEDAFAARYVPEIDPSDFDGALISTAEIKAAISRFTCRQPVKPVAGGKQALIDQLAALCEAACMVGDLDGTVDQLKDRIRRFDEDAPVAPVSRVEATGEDGQPFMRPAVKDDWIDQLLVLDPTARAWDRIVTDHLSHHEGKRLISAKDERRIRIAAHMILKHPDAGAMLREGYSEVSIFWYCRKTGVPMKARLDWLKLNTVLDLKTFSNKSGMPVDKAILRAIANYTYNLQHVVYEEAVMEARAMVREHEDACIYHLDLDLNQQQASCAERDRWCRRWAEVIEAPRFIFVFQQSGIAPVTRVFQMPQGEIWRASHRMAEDLKRLWAKCASTYGCEAWLDHQPMTEIEDELIPMWSTERGTFYDA
jgi:hypothetical protein